MASGLLTGGMTGGLTGGVGCGDGALLEFRGFVSWSFDSSSDSGSSSDSASSSDEDVADGQNLTLKQLNNLLLRYIDQVRDMDHNMGSTYTTSIDR